MARKGQGLSLNTIILAAIGIIVLLVLIYIVLDQIGVFDDTLTECEQRGSSYRCQESCDEPIQEQPTLSCGEDAGLICCFVNA